MAKNSRLSLTVKGKQKLVLNLKRQLDICGLSQRDFAKDCGLSEQMVSHLLNGRTTPTLATILAIRDALNKHTTYELKLDKLLLGVKYSK